MYQIKRCEFHRQAYNCNVLASVGDSYYASISKEEGKWVVYAEDHDTEEMHFLLENGAYYATLRDAKVALIEFAEYFSACFVDNKVA